MATVAVSFRLERMVNQHECERAACLHCCFCLLAELSLLAHLRTEEVACDDAVQIRITCGAERMV